MKELYLLITSNSKNIVTFIAIISVFFEIVPIKFSPITLFLKWLGKKINADINARVVKLEDTVLENHKKELRIQISNFASDLRHNVPKSESQFIAIIELCDEYLENKWNSKVKLDAEFIKEEYMKIGNKIKVEKVKI